MSNTVIKVAARELDLMKKFYMPSLSEKVPPGGVFAAKLPGCTITAYKSGKVMFQGKSHESEAARWGSPVHKQAPQSKTSGSPLPPSISAMSVMGSDEVGTGDYFGPMTVVAAFVEKEQIPLLKELGVKDSKNLNDVQIVEIAKNLLTFLPYSLLVLPNEKYNRLQASGMTQGKMKAILHNQALNNLLGKISPLIPEAILIDQFAEADIYFRHLKDQKKVCRSNVFFSTKAESVHLAVAAASILARYAFIKEFEKLSKEAGFTLPKGAGRQVDEAAARLIRKHGKQSLMHFTKVHFANTGKAEKLAEKR